MYTSLISGLLFALLLANPSLAAHHPSPCPDIFQYEGPEPENNRWFGEVSLRTEESLVGIRLDVELDRPSDLMVSWMGDITTNDNMKFTVLNLNQRLRPGPPVLSRIMVKFNRTVGSPKLQIIRLNGRQICPEDTGGPPEYQESSRPQKPQSTRRPDPEFGENYGETVDEYPVNGNLNNNNEKPRPTSQSNNNNNNRPNSNNSPNTDSLNSSNNRPVYKPTTTTTEEPYTTRRNSKITTTQRVPNNSNSNRPNSNSNNNNPNTVSLQASSTDSNSEINGVINGLLQNNQNKNKTVIITVIENNNNQEQQNNNRPNGGSSGNNENRPVATENSSQSRPNSNNRPTEQQTTSNNQNRPNSNNRPTEQHTTSSTQNRPNNSNQGSSSISSNTLNSQQPSNSVSCGEVKLAVPLVTSGQATHRGQWPWHVALYLIEGINLSYHCGGSLVSKNKIITAAHCITTKQNDGVINSTKLVVYLGKYHQLHYSDELGIQTKQVIRISVYPSYNSSNYLGDIAVLTLSSEAEFTNYVMPVCLWDEKSDNLNDIVGKEGTVVGWGFDENDTPTEELKMAKMPVVSHQTCIWSYPQFFSEFTSDKTFCAGFRNGISDKTVGSDSSQGPKILGPALKTAGGANAQPVHPVRTSMLSTSVCNGDSGGGMVFNKNNRWYLRGIVSVTVAKEGLRVCDTRHYVVFTDVAKYVDFIKNNLRR